MGLRRYGTVGGCLAAIYHRNPGRGIGCDLGGDFHAALSAARQGTHLPRDGMLGRVVRPGRVGADKHDFVRQRIDKAHLL